MPASLSRPLDIDFLDAAAAVRRRSGSFLLHGQRPWGGLNESVLLLDPLWSVRVGADGHKSWNGKAPTDSLRNVDPRGLPALLGQHCPAGLRIGGWLGYDLGPARWGARRSVAPPFSLPDAWLGLYDAALVGLPGQGCRLELCAAGELAPAQGALEARADALEELLRQSAPSSQAGSSLGDIRLPDPDWHSGAVEKIREHLLAGDVYQVNLTGFASAATSLDPWAAFLHQAHLNPVSLAAWLQIDETTISSHSPELLLSRNGQKVWTGPIKGTCPSGQCDAASLRASEKDRAEHIMIVDLCRNDLGRSCEFGSVRVEALMEGLELRGLVHLVSRIEGMLRPGESEGLMRSLFPGGSITGAPKKRAMEIITQVERSARGPYCGSFGWESAQASRWNIAIRTAVWQDAQVHFGCGGGIVLDSDSGREYAELVLKASSFLESLRATASPPPTGEIR